MSVLVVHTYGLQERIGENMRVKVEKYGTIQASKDLLNFLVMALNDAMDGQEDKDIKVLLLNIEKFVTVCLMCWMKPVIMTV